LYSLKDKYRKSSELEENSIILNIGLLYLINKVRDIAEIEYGAESEALSLNALIILIVVALVIIIGIFAFLFYGQGFDIVVSVICGIISKLPFGLKLMSLLLHCPSLGA